MDLSKEIIDFTEIKSSGAKTLTGEDFGIFSNSDKNNKIQQESTATAAVLKEAISSEKSDNKMAAECMRKPTTPQLIENAANVTTIKTNLAGDISPPPRPLTSSEVVGFITTLEDPEMQLDPTIVLNKSRSLPASPNHLKSSHMADIFTFKADKALVKPTAFMAADKKLTNIVKPHGEPLTRNCQQFCLRWNNYQTNLTNVFDELLQNESFVDVTLACEGQSIKAHKMILSACSPYFQALFYDNPCQHPIIIMRDVRWQELKALMEFMYKGEINVSQEQINPLLKVAEMLKIRGLAEVSTSGGNMAAQQLIPEQRMTVYDEDEEDRNECKTVLNEAEEEEDNNTDCSKAKRPRIQISAKNSAVLDLKLAEQRLRKRSRDGLLIDEERLAAQRLSRTPTPPAQEKFMESAPLPMVVLPASTIVRNPFASPNPSNQPAATNTSGNSTTSSSSSSSTSGSQSGSATSNSSNSAAISYRPRERSISPSLLTPLARGESLSAASPTSGSTPQISIHPHPAAAAAAALANPHHPHHHAAAAAQQFAAQQQLHAAHSHAAMASALGASLAAAAAGSTSTGPTSSAGSSTHHDDMEIKPEIAEMIREEERVSLVLKSFAFCI